MSETLSSPITWGLIWIVVAAVIGMLPRRFHPWGAVPLLLTGMPLLWLIFAHAGALAGLMAVAVLVSVLRYPLMYLGRRAWWAVARRLSPEAEGAAPAEAPTAPHDRDRARAASHGADRDRVPEGSEG